MRIYKLVLLFLAFNVNLHATTTDDKKELQIQYGSYIFVDGSKYIFLEISPKEVALESGFTVLCITAKSEYNGDLKMSNDQKSGQFIIGMTEYTVTAGNKENESLVHLIIKNSSDFDHDRFHLSSINALSEYRAGSFKSKTEYGDRFMKIQEKLSDHKLAHRAYFSVNLFGGDDGASDYIALPSDVKNTFYLFNEKYGSTYELTYNENERNYIFQFMGNSRTYNLDASAGNEAKQHKDGTFFFEAAIAGSCEINASNDVIDLKLEFDAEIRKNIKKVSIKCHLDGLNVVVDECAGISKDELIIYLENGVFQLKGIQEYPIYINTLKGLWD